MKGKHPGGRPTKYDPRFHPSNFIELSKTGKSFKQIAAIWEIDRDTIQEWRKRHREFSVAVKKGRELCEAWYIDLGHHVIESNEGYKNLGMYVWLTKNIFKWSENNKEEEVEDRPLENLTDEELDKL